MKERVCLAKASREHPMWLTLPHVRCITCTFLTVGAMPSMQPMWRGRCWAWQEECLAISLSEPPHCAVGARFSIPSV